MGKETRKHFFRYDAFDFHKECSNMRWHRLSILANRLAPKQEEFGLVSCHVYIILLLACMYAMPGGV